MAIILFINATNDKLFPKDGDNMAEQLILPQHSVILALTIDYAGGNNVLFERTGRIWQITTEGLGVQKNNNQIEQMMFAWQQSSGLVQAADIMIEGEPGLTVNIALAGESFTRTFTLYPLADQLLIHKQLDNSWLALPAALAQQLLPVQ